MRTSIIGTFFLASPAELQQGRVWYQQANDIARMIGCKYELPTAIVAGVIAALSPQNPWERNVLDAENLCQVFTQDGRDAVEGVKVGTFGANKRKAIRILELGLVFTAKEILTILNGLKVQNFWWCIQLDNKAVCVDGHAYSIWLGERVSTTDTPKITPKLYERIAQDYVTATGKINEILDASYTPAQVQAITWVVHRNMYANQRKSRAK